MYAAVISPRRPFSHTGRAVCGLQEGAAPTRGRGKKGSNEARTPAKNRARRHAARVVVMNPCGGRIQQLAQSLSEFLPANSHITLITRCVLCVRVYPCRPTSLGVTVCVHARACVCVCVLLITRRTWKGGVLRPLHRAAASRVPKAQPAAPQPAHAMD